jgi:hypothetical protein
MAQHVCEHLRALEDELVAGNRKITFAGQAWSSNCRHWVYVDEVLDCEALIRRLKLGAGVTVHSNHDPRSGRERGLVCGPCKDAVVGVHPEDGRGRPAIS